jgi:predicted nucleic acid-binding protein
VALIVDTGPLVALLDATDRWPGAFRSPLAASDAGCLELLDLPVRWLLRAGDLADRYRDPLGLVDATALAPTEMLAETKLATLDRRRFSAVRPADNRGADDSALRSR